MNQEENDKMSSIIEEAKDYFISREAVLEALRYRSLRKLSASQYTTLCQRNVKGENFDEMVDKLVLEDNK